METRNRRAAISVRCLLLVASLPAVQACGGGGGGPTESPPAGAPVDDGSGPQAVPPPPEGGQPPTVPPATGVPPGAIPASAAGLTVFFRLDPRLTTSSYMGDRWVAPATFTFVAETIAVLHARARVLHVQGTVDATATWTAADPEMLAVSPGTGHEVAITVRREGRSSLTVASADGSRELVVTAARHAGSWRVDVTQ